MPDIDFAKHIPDLTLLQGGKSPVRAPTKPEPFKADPELNHYNRDQVRDVVVGVGERNSTLSKHDVAAIDTEVSRLSENYIEFMESPQTVDRLALQLQDNNAPEMVSDYLYNIAKPESPVEQEAALMAMRFTDAVEQVQDRRAFYDRFNEVKASVDLEAKPTSVMEAYFHHYGKDANIGIYSERFAGIDIVRNPHEINPDTGLVEGAELADNVQLESGERVYFWVR